MIEYFQPLYTVAEAAECDEQSYGWLEDGIEVDVL